MAYDIFTKPTWLTPEEARNTVATSLGWCLLHPRSNKFEILVSIKDLDKKLAEKESGEEVTEHVPTTRAEIISRPLGDHPETTRSYKGAKRGPKTKAEKALLAANAVVEAKKSKKEEKPAEESKGE